MGLCPHGWEAEEKQPEEKVLGKLSRSAGHCLPGPQPLLGGVRAAHVSCLPTVLGTVPSTTRLRLGGQSDRAAQECLLLDSRSCRRPSEEPPHRPLLKLNQEPPAGPTGRLPVSYPLHHHPGHLHGSTHPGPPQLPSPGTACCSNTLSPKGAHATTCLVTSSGLTPSSEPNPNSYPTESPSASPVWSHGLLPLLTPSRHAGLPYLPPT